MTPLVNALLLGIETRFLNMLNSQDYSIAAILIRKLKLNFVLGEAGKAQYKLMLTNSVCTVVQDDVARNQSTESRTLQVSISNTSVTTQAIK